MSRLHSIVMEILKSYSYEVCEDGNDDIVSAHRGDRHVVVGIAPDNRNELIKYLNKFISATDGFDGQRVISTMCREIPEEVLKTAEETGIAVWGYGTIESELGRLSLECSKLSEVDSEPSPTDKKEFEPEVETKVRDWGEQILMPKMSLEDVTELAKYTIRGFKYELELVPYYIFEFACEVISDGRNAGEKRNGIICVNALSGEYELWKTRFELIPELRWAHTKLEPRIDVDRAESIAYDGVIAVNTVEIENIVDRGSALIIERKKMRPKEGAVSIRNKGIVYLPVWCIEGSRGIMLVNAVSKKIIKEEIYKD